jgi:RimJ/RimL family protein N-acetyltransferase
MEPVEIHEANLILRPWLAEDADTVFEACQDPVLQRWTRVPRPYLREHAEGFTAGALDAWARGDAAPLGVFDAATGRMLGAHGLVKIDREEGWAEVGYWTAPWARGRGVATTATRAVARWVLGPGAPGGPHGALGDGPRRLIWRAEVGNHASRLVAERAGFLVEGIQRRSLPRPGEVTMVDYWLGGLLPGEIREADRPLEPWVAARAKAFGRAAPVLEAVTEAGEKLTLRVPAEPDLADVLLACRDPETIRWTTVPDPYADADGEFWIHDHVPARWACGEAANFVIADPAGRYSGAMSLRLSAADPLVADVGFAVAPWARGRGYATAALRAVCRWGFEQLCLARIEWRAYLGNDASRTVAERTGFRVEGIERAAGVQRGVRRDQWVGAVLAGEVT